LTKDLETSTSEVCKSIKEFMKINKKYFGTVFCYEGTNYIESSEREVNEINDIVRIIRDEEAEEAANKKVIINIEV
jgi:hypothetical protein